MAVETKQPKLAALAGTSQSHLTRLAESDKITDLLKASPRAACPAPRLLMPAPASCNQGPPAYHPRAAPSGRAVVDWSLSPAPRMLPPAPASPS